MVIRVTKENSSFSPEFIGCEVRAIDLKNDNKELMIYRHQYLRHTKEHAERKILMVVLKYLFDYGRTII